MIEDKITIAVLGDLHGHINLALSILKKWEIENKTNLDSILQVGDLGYFPDISKLDRATLKFAKEDPEELGFQDFLQETDASRRHFYGEETKLNSDLVFIAGNHDDQDKLRELESSARHFPVPVDYYGKILYLPAGEIYEINKGKLKIKVSGLGRISGNSQNYNFTNADLRKVKSLSNIDILLTHEPQSGIFNERGSEEVREVLQSLNPDYHFCGHIHQGQELEQLGKTKSYILDQVGFRKRHKLNEKCVGILTIEKDKSAFKFIDELWLKEFKKDKPHN